MRKEIYHKIVPLKLNSFILDDNQVTVSAQYNADNLTLRNSFELLETDTEQVIGEAIPNDLESTHTILDMQMDKNPNVEENSPEKVILAQSTNIEDLGNLVKKNSQPVALNSSKDTANGVARDPIFHDNLTLQPIISPITTNDEILGQDKRKIHFTAGPKNLSAACLKDGKILSKYWGDEDTDATEGTLEPDTDHEAHKSNSQSSLEHDIDTAGTLANLKETADQYLLQHSHEDGFIKPGRKGWKKAAKTLDGNSSVRVSTRHKKTSVRLKDQA